MITGQIIGRWGNFFNCEAFGGYTDSLLAMRIKRSLVNENMLNGDVLNHLIVENGVEYIQVHPTFLYESLWNLGLLMFMLWYRKRKKFDGEMLWIYLVGYGLGRFWIEGLRTDQLILFGTGIAVSQGLSLILVLASVGVLIYHYCRLFKRQKEKTSMGISKEELVQKIEAARKKLNRSIENGEEYKTVYQYSVELDHLIEAYLLAEY